MKIRKSFKKVNPELLYAEVRDFTIKQGAAIAEQKMETYALPDDSSTFITRGTLSFVMPQNKETESLRAHIVGSVKSDTKLMLDIDENLFPQEKISALKDDLDFIFGAYEIKEK